MKRRAKKGIAICPAWRDSFEAFVADMGERPPGKKLGRLDPTKGFQTANCAWMVDRDLKAARPTTPHYEWRGEARTIPAIAAMEDVPIISLKRQIWKNVPVDEAIRRVRRNRRKK